MQNVDFKKLAVWMLPSWLRGNTVLLILHNALWPIRQKYGEYVRFVNDTLYKLQHNGQVCYLRKVLNDKCDPVDRRILIEDFDGLVKLYFWPDADNRDYDFSLTWFFWGNDMYEDSGVDFVVKVPYSIVTTTSEIAYLKSLANEFKLAGKRYIIVRYN